MDYGDYLQLETLLGAQETVTDEHDELLFIVIHQATELWLKLSVHEITSAAEAGSSVLKMVESVAAQIDRHADHVCAAFEPLSRACRNSVFVN